MNLLPLDGLVTYQPATIDAPSADSFLEKLIADIPWKHDEAHFFGKHIVTKRMVAWYGDEPFAYGYSNVTREALNWSPMLLQLKKITEDLTKQNFNSCLLNFYHSGEEGMSWHSDDEPSLERNSTIASLSFGAERKFKMKHKKYADRCIELALSHGSLLLMQEETQKFWLHSLPKTKRISAPRVSLTFRTMVTDLVQVKKQFSR